MGPLLKDWSLNFSINLNHIDHAWWWTQFLLGTCKKNVCQMMKGDLFKNLAKKWFNRNWHTQLPISCRGPKKYYIEWIKECTKKGLCWNFDEKCQIGCHCKEKLLLMFESVKGGSDKELDCGGVCLVTCTLLNVWSTVSYT